MIRHMLDTSICIEIIRRKSSQVLARLRTCPVGSVAISAITFAELQYGCSKSNDPQRNALAVAEFCAPLVILPFDNLAASAYGAIRAELESSGTPIGPLDTLIAAHALSVPATLVTHNPREFERVKVLQVEDWTD